MPEYWEDAAKERHQHRRRVIETICKALISVAGIVAGAIAVLVVFHTIEHSVTSGHRRDERIKISRTEACNGLKDETLRTFCIVQGAQ